MSIKDVALAYRMIFATYKHDSYYGILYRDFESGRREHIVVVDFDFEKQTAEFVGNFESYMDEQLFVDLECEGNYEEDLIKMLFAAALEEKQLIITHLRENKIHDFVILSS